MKIKNKKLIKGKIHICNIQSIDSQLKNKLCTLKMIINIIFN